jgi:Fe-S cluster assembly ATPase SufC
MPLLEVKNLHVEVADKKILNGLDLTVEKGKVHAIMGPNGSGKSTLSYVLAGKSGYEITAGGPVQRREHPRRWSRMSARPRGCSSPSNIRSKSPASPP